MDIKTDASKTVIKKRLLIFLDLETTGLEVQKHEVIEIGALKVAPRKPFKMLDQLFIKVKPKDLKNASKSALKLVGYSPEEWENALDIDKALKNLDEFSENGVLVGYNVSFDWSVLDRAYFSLGRQDPFYYHRLDVMPMAYLKLFSQRSLKRFSLGEICKYFKVPEGIKHNALDDAMATYLVFKKLFSYTD